MATKFTLGQLAERIGGVAEGDPEFEIAGAASLAQAGRHDLVFVESPTYLALLEDSRARAVILPPGLEPQREVNVIRFAKPALGMARALDFLLPRVRHFADISPAAYLGNNVEIGEDVGIGPGAYIGNNVRIGRGTEIHPGTCIGRNAEIGEDCVLHSGVHIYESCALGDRVVLHSGVVVGADGFGFVQEALSQDHAEAGEPVRHRKVPQIGNVVLDDDVEVGANSTIDRGSFDSTRIGRGTKIDNLVMIGHNCQVGRHCFLVAQSGVSGSTKIGDYATLAAQAGLVGHIEIGSRAIVGAQSGVTKSVPEGKAVFGSPAFEFMRAKKATAVFQRLPELRERINQLEKAIRELREPDQV